MSAWLCWIFPLIGALVTPLLAKIGDKVRDYAALIFSLLAAVASAYMMPHALAGRVLWQQVEWIPQFGLKAGVLADPLAIFMANIVAWLSFLIMVYSLGYMHGERGLTRYWALMNLFIGGMLFLVLSDNLLQMFIGWEIVGFCSYALIGFWHEDEKEHWVGTPPNAYPPSDAGMKAFMVTKVGDISLLMAILIVYYFAGTFNFMELSQHIRWLSDLSRAGLLLPTTIFFLGGPIGKSAQFPLHEWLPEAMAGPAPVSALIHAATMVKAGVYLIARVIPIFLRLPLPELQIFFTAVAWIGGFTAFMAATQAVVQREIKKVLAYSTMSQIGYMMLALGTCGFTLNYPGGYVAGAFHLLNHAVFKASLFLGAGSIIHACGTRFMDEMGGIRKAMPITFACMLIGALSLSGVPPLSGFWSKDAILLACLRAGQYPLYGLAAVTAALTLFYSIRMISLTFLGKRSYHLKEIHEAPRVMWAPSLLLTLITVAISIVGPSLEEGLHGFFEPTFGRRVWETTQASNELSTIAMTTSFLMLLLGGLPACYLYVMRKIEPARLVEEHRSLQAIRSFLWNRWYINAFYYKVFVDGVIGLSRSVFNGLEMGGIDRLQYLVSGGVVRFCGTFRKNQTGVLSDNMLYVQVGLLILLAAFVAIFFQVV